MILKTPNPEVYQYMKAMLKETTKLAERAPSLRRTPHYSRIEKELTKGVLLVGLRGVGKTTILHQLAQKYIYYNPLYVPADSIPYTLKEIVEAYLYMKKEEKGILLIDEAQTTKEWDHIAKYIKDFHPNILLAVSGSNALELQVSADVKRRMITIPLPPMSFCEWMAFKYKQPKLPLPFHSLKAIRSHLLGKPQIEREKEALMKLIDNTPANLEEEFYHYALYGGFPFAQENSPAIYPQLRDIALRIAERDIPQLGNIESQTLQVARDLVAVLPLYMIGVPVSLQSLSQQEKLQGVTLSTLNKALDLLERSGLIFALPMCHKYKTVAERKAKKRYFPTPSLLAAFHRWSMEDIYSIKEIKGYLIEHYVAGFLKQLADYYNLSLCYDMQKNGKETDFKLGDQKIEVKSHPAKLSLGKITISYNLEVRQSHLPVYLLC